MISSVVGIAGCLVFLFSKITFPPNDKSPAFTNTLLQEKGITWRVGVCLGKKQKEEVLKWEEEMGRGIESKSCWKNARDK